MTIWEKRLPDFMPNWMAIYGRAAIELLTQRKAWGGAASGGD